MRRLLYTCCVFLFFGEFVLKFLKKTVMIDSPDVASYNEDNKLADRVALLCYESFSKLPKKGKPQLGKEWTILAAVVRLSQRDKRDLKVVSIGTGSRCIGQNKLSENGDLLNDSHAEVLARRGFLRYLYQELELAYTKQTSDTFEFDESIRKCKLKPDVSFIIFTTHTPCGDGSIIPKEPNSTNESEELQPCSEVQTTTLEDGNPPEKKSRLDDSVPDIYRTGAKCVQGGLQDSKLSGVDHHVVGVLRTKPGRGDQTLSMSCSDKITKWNIVGLQGSLLMNFLEKPIYFSHLVIGKCPFNLQVMIRAVYARFSQEDHLIQQKPKVLHSNEEFVFSKIQSKEGASQDLKPCPSSVIWSANDPDEVEVAVDGRKQGVTKKNINKPSSRLKVCKKNLYQSFAALLQNIPDERTPEHLHSFRDEIKTTTYHEAKKLATNYCAMWAETKKRVMPTWTKKDDQLLHFTAQD